MTRPQLSSAGDDSARNTIDTDIASLNLSRLLSRFEQNFLSSTATSTANIKLLKQSQYHRRRVRANVDYAQSLILQIERSLPKIKSPERRHDRHTELMKRKNSLKLIQGRLDTIAEEADVLRRQRQLKNPGTLSNLSGFNGVGDERGDGGYENGDNYKEDVDDEDDNDEEGREGEDEGEEDLLAHLSDHEEEGAVVPTIVVDRQPEDCPLATETLPTSMTESVCDAPTSTNPSTLMTTTSTIIATTPATGTTTPAVPATNAPIPTIRQRHTTKASPSASLPGSETYTSSSSYYDHKDDLSITKPISIRKLNQSEPQKEIKPQNPQTTESKLTSDRHEQDSLTDSLLSLASQLKASSHAFQSSLEVEKSILNRAVEGLDRNVTGLDVAGRRMNMLRRMTEGRGWWGRILMYVWIFGLWLVAIGIVFLGPKLRF